MLKRHSLFTLTSRTLDADSLTFTCRLIVHAAIGRAGILGKGLLSKSFLSSGLLALRVLGVRLLGVGLLGIGLGHTAYAGSQTQPHTQTQASGQTNTQASSPTLSPSATQSLREALGAAIFHDTSLSQPAGQSCATCHNPATAFADPNPTSEGAVKGSFGSRNAPSLLYAQFSPPFHKAEHIDQWLGGQFWDGRVDSLKEQALGPFFNPIEMNSTPALLAQALRRAPYRQQIIASYGQAVFDSTNQLVDAAADALAAFQQTEVFAPFDAKYDYAQAQLIELTAQEQHGESIFNNNVMCLDCHAGRGNHQDIFTRFVHHNILVPPNPSLAFYSQPAAVNPAGKAFVDKGTAANPKLSAQHKVVTQGLFKTPTLRNIAVTAPYMHNGVFKTLEEVIDFYNKMEPFWPPEVSDNKSPLVATSLNMTEQEKAALIAFLNTLTDGYPATPALKAKLRAYQQTLGQWD